MLSVREEANGWHWVLRRGGLHADAMGEIGFSTADDALAAGQATLEEEKRQEEHRS